MPPTRGHFYAKYALTTVTHCLACDAECILLLLVWLHSQLAEQLRGVATHLVCLVQRIGNSAPQAAVLLATEKLCTRTILLFELESRPVSTNQAAAPDVNVCTHAFLLHRRKELHGPLRRLPFPATALSPPSPPPPSRKLPIRHLYLSGQHSLDNH